MFFTIKLGIKVALYALIFVAIYSVSTCSELYIDMFKNPSLDETSEYWNDFKQCSDPRGAFDWLGQKIESFKESDFVQDSEIIENANDALKGAVSNVLEK